MSIERAIHQRWAADVSLTSLVSGARLYTGTAPGTLRPPYATLTRVGAAPLCRTSSGTALDETRFELALWAEDLDTAQRIAAAVFRRFERSHFDHPAGRVLLMRLVDHDERREEDATWRVTLTYLVLNETPDPGITSHV